MSNSGTLTTGITAGNWGGFGTAGSVNVSLTNTGIVNPTVGTLTLAGSNTSSEPLLWAVVPAWCCQAQLR